jgi:hypothetical protein
MGSPFEWLRSIARSGGDDTTVALEAASALASIADEPASLVVACRRVLAHHRSNGALWWVCAHLLAGSDPWAAARNCRDRLDADATAARLRDALPLLDAGRRVATVGFHGVIAEALEARVDLDVVAMVDPDDRAVERAAAKRGGLIDPWQLGDLDVAVLLVPVRTCSPERALVDAVASDALYEARDAQVWLVAATGRMVPERVFAAIVAASASDERVTTVDTTVAHLVVTPGGLDSHADLLGRVDCPIAAELLRPF